MKNISWQKQIVAVAIVACVAGLISFLLTALPGRGGPPTPFVGLGIGVVAGGIYLALSGNRQVAIADDDTRRAALAPSTDGSARLIAFRQGFVAKLAGIDVIVDGVVRTQLKSPRFAVLTLTPGEHVVETRMQNKTSAPLSMTLTAGEAAAVEVVAGLGSAKPVARTDIAAVRDGLARVPMVVA